MGVEAKNRVLPDMVHPSADRAVSITTVPTLRKLEPCRSGYASGLNIAWTTCRSSTGS